MLFKDYISISVVKNGYVVYLEPNGSVVCPPMVVFTTLGDLTEALPVILSLPKEISEE